MTIAAAIRATSWRIAAAAALTLLALGMLGRVGGAASGGGPKTHTVTIEATSFKPDRLTVAVGDTVVWVNKDPFPHTATAAGAFDSGGSTRRSRGSFFPPKRVRLTTFAHSIPR